MARFPSIQKVLLCAYHSLLGRYIQCIVFKCMWTYLLYLLSPYETVLVKLVMGLCSVEHHGSMFTVSQRLFRCLNIACMPERQAYSLSHIVHFIFPKCCNHGIHCHLLLNTGGTLSTKNTRHSVANLLPTPYRVLLFCFMPKLTK